MTYTVPGFYAIIEDYQLNTMETAQALKEDALIYFGDLPDFVYVPDENSTDINAVRRVRITPNTIIPITNVDEAIKSLTGENILDGILSQEQKDELLCKDMVNVIKMSREVALQGKLAVVKIVKRDGHRPDINNKFEVFQALENAYEKLGNVKASQIVPIGISGDIDFVSAVEKQPALTIVQSKEQGAVALDKIYNDIYSFAPVEKVSDLKVELAFAKPEVLVHTGSTAEQALIKKEGLDSPKVKEHLKGKVLVNGQVKAENIQLEFQAGNFVSVEEVNVSIVTGEANLIIGAGTVFATVLTEELATKTVAKLDATGKPLLNHYVADQVKAEVLTFEAVKTTCQSNEIIEFTGTLKEAAPEFTAKLAGADFELTEPVALQADGITFKAKGRFTAEGAKEVTLTVEAPFVAATKKANVQVTGVAAANLKVKAVAPRLIEKVSVSGVNQHVMINIDKPTSNWIEVKNIGNPKEVVDKIAILEGVRNGVEQYNVAKSGTVVLTFKEAAGQYKAVLADKAEILAPVEYAVATRKEQQGTVLAGTTYLAYEGMTVVLYDGLMIDPTPLPVSAVESVYFDVKADLVGAPQYVINYVPANSEPIMASLKYVANQVKSFSEVLMVWGTSPASSADPDVADRHVRELVNLPKFKKGFKVRTSATSEKDYGMFLSVVAGTVKVNGIGGISNFDSFRVVDFEREQGGIGEIKPLTDKVFVELTSEFSAGSNVEIKTYVGVKQKTVEAIVLSTKEVLGKTMLTLDRKIDTTIFDLKGFEVIISNTDAKDRHGSYAAAAFAIAANEERDRAPIQKDVNGVADFNFSQESLALLIQNKFTVINKNLATGKAVIVDTPVMTRKDSDYQSRSSIGTVLTLLKALRRVANDKKGKRFPKKEDKVMLEDELRNVFVNELNKSDSLIANYRFETDMSKLDSKGHLYVAFRVKDAKKLEVVEFAGGLAKL